MTRNFLISAATAGALAITAGAAFAQSTFDPSARKQIDDRSVAADIPIMWQRDANGALVLDSTGQPIRIYPAAAPPATVWVDTTAPVSVSAPASTVVVDPGTYVDYSLPPRLEIVTSAPVPDTPANRARYGGPLSNAGNRTAPVGN